MKTRITLLLLFAAVCTLQAQLRITEISYNSPESGTDSLEYVEIYNASADAINLEGYIVEDNNAQDTLPAMMLGAGEYILTAVNVAAIQAVLGITALPTPNVAYRNSGELIMLLDPMGDVVDMVDYSPDAPWPTFMEGTSGEGASIELCNLEANGNNGGNWRAATNDLGVTINDKAMLGTPAAANTTTCTVAADVTANGDNTFTPADITVNVGDKVTWLNAGGFHNINGTQDAYPDNPASFGNGDPSADAWTFEHTFTVPGLYDYRCDPHVNFGMVGTVTVMGEPQIDYPVRTVAELRENNADGFPMLFDSLLQVEGVTHGVNFRSGGLQFTVVDDNGDGIAVFSFEDDFGIDYQEGLRISVTGTLGFFNGLTQISPDNVIVMTSDNSLTGPDLVNVLDESTESQLVTIDQPLTFVDPTQWTGSGSGFNVDMTDGTNTYTIRIDNDCDLYGSSIPSDPLLVTGIGGQFDNEAPFDGGYQIFPRYSSDMDPFSSNEEEVEVSVELYPNPVLDKINIVSDQTIERLEVNSASGQLILSTRGSSRLDVSGLTTGMYYLTVHTGGSATVLPFNKQ